MPLLKEPAVIEEADFLVMESTYGNRLHENNSGIERAKQFLNIVHETLQRGGNVIIPSFAVGRTQEMLYEINKIKDRTDSDEFVLKYQELMKAPVYVDSPLAISATEVFMNHLDLFDEETQKRILESGDNPLEFPGLKFTRTVEESKMLNETTRKSIIISASGMCEVGRIKHHLKHNLWNPNSTILFVGYQGQGTLGRKILDGAKKVKIFGEEVAINARIEYIEGYSGHADQKGLLNFIQMFSKKPKAIFLVHGEEESQTAFKKEIESKWNLNVWIPSFGEEYELDKIAEKTMQLQIPNEYKYLRLEIVERIESLKEELEDMGMIVKEEKLNVEIPDEKIMQIKQKLQQIEKEILAIVEI